MDIDFRSYQLFITYGKIQYSKIFANKMLIMKYIYKYTNYSRLFFIRYINLIFVIRRIKEMRENETKREKKERVTRDSDKSSK